MVTLVRLEGIHHVTCITGDAPRNVDFYARLLGLRLVKKTVNQDDPTVYHLFYADEQGSPGSDITFFEYPGARRGRAGTGMIAPDRWRVGSEESLDFWESVSRGGRADAARRRALHSTTRRASAWSSRSSRLATSRSSPSIPSAGGARAPGLRQRPRLRPTPSEAATARGRAWLRSAGRPLGGARRERGGLYGYDPHPPSAGVPGAGTVHHVAWSSTMEVHAAWPARERGGRAPDTGDRPLLVPLDLLPRAERRALRDRDARPGLRRRRRSRASRGDAHPAPAFEHLRARSSPS